MAIDVACACGARFSVQDDWAGRKAKCRKCQAVVTIPSPRASGPTGESADSDELSDLFNEELPVAAVSPAAGSRVPRSRSAKQRRVKSRTAKRGSQRRKMTSGGIIKLALALGAVFMAWLALSAVLRELNGNRSPGSPGAKQGQSVHRSSDRRTRTVDELIPTENVSRMVGGPGGERRIEGAYGFIGSPMEQRMVTGIMYSVNEWEGRKTFATFRPYFARKSSGNDTRSKTVHAREGYAVGGIIVNADDIVHAVKMIFMRVVDEKRLDPSDSYTSDWLGQPSGASEEEINGRGRRVVGFMVRRMAAVDAVGLIYD